MGFFDRILGGTAANDSIWNHIISEEQIDDLILQSNERVQVIFKHSHSCGTSFFAKKSLDVIPSEEVSEVDLHLINVISSRQVSLYVAQKLGIRHESPQLLVIKNGEVVWHGSHQMVSSQNLIQALG